MTSNSPVARIFPSIMVLLTLKCLYRERVSQQAWASGFSFSSRSGYISAAIASLITKVMPLPVNSNRNKKIETSFPATFFTVFIALLPFLRTIIWQEGIDRNTLDGSETIASHTEKQLKKQVLPASFLPAITSLDYSASSAWKPFDAGTPLSRTPMQESPWAVS